MQPNPDGSCSIRGAHGKYLCCEPGGRFVVDRPAPGPWESFQLLVVGRERCIIRSVAHGHVLCSPGQGAALEHRSGYGGAWELFTTRF